MNNSRFLPFEEARKYARSLKLKSSTKWIEFCKSPDFPHNIPKRPEGTYAHDGWNGYSDWLGNGWGKFLSKDKGRLSFEDAREYVKKLKLSGLSGWIAYCKSGKRPANIPASPHTAYKDEGWNGYGDWTGTGRVRRTSFLPFEEARKYARSLNLYSTVSWDKFSQSDKRPANIPSQPDRTYKKEWQGWKNWLNNSDEVISEHLVPIETEMDVALDSVINNLKNKFLPYGKAREYVRTLKIKGQKEWLAYVKTDKKPANIPSAPYQVYDEWVGFPDWLGTKRIRETSFLTFEKAREYVRTLNLKGQKEWNIFVKSDKKPTGIPTSPEVTYAKTGEWTNWYDFLGMVREKSGQGAAVRRIISRYQELDKFGLSEDEIMNKLFAEFPRQSESKIKEILLKLTEN